MRVLITDSDNRSALAATRSLGRAGHEIIVAGETAQSLAASSKYCSAFISAPSPLQDPARFVDSIVTAASAQRVDVLLPMTEVTTLLLTEHRARLPTHCILPFASEQTLRTASDKAAMVRLASTLGAPVPATHFLNAMDELAALLPQLTFPIVIKPARSRVHSSAGWISTSVTYANNSAELQARLTKLAPETYPVLLQEKIEGPGVGFFACYDHGAPVAFFAHRRLREKPPSGGVSVLRESTPVAEDALRYGAQLLDALNWHGVAMVEFKRDIRDGSLRLMEINARFWGSLQLAIDAGVDFPRLLVDIARGATPTPIQSYRHGVRSRWLLGDLDVLLMLLTRKRSSLNLPANFPSRWRVLRDFFEFWRKDQRDEVFRWDDPRPGKVELIRWLGLAKR